MALPPPSTKRTNAELDEFRRQLEELSQKEIPKARIRLKALGGAYGDYNRRLAENTEAIIFAQKQLGQGDFARQSQAILEQTMTYIDRAALRSRMIVKESMLDKSAFEKEMAKIDDDMSNAKTEEEKKSLQRLKKDLAQRATVEDISRMAMRKAQESFLAARTDMDREMAQVAGQAILNADKKLLEMTMVFRQKHERKSLDLQDKIAKTTDAKIKNALVDELYVVKKGSDALLERERQLGKAIVENTKLQEETLGSYKAGIRGFTGELMSKTFTGGLIGAIFKGTGWMDLIPNMGMMMLERSGLLEKMGGGVASLLLGSDSEQAKKAGSGSAQTAAIVAKGSEDMSKLSEAGLHAGSIYTHDIHSEKTLMDIYEFLTGNKASASAAPSATGSKGAKIGKIKGTLSGIGAFLQSIAQGIASFGDRGVFKGALGLAAVGAAMIPFAFGMSIMTSLPVAGLLASTLAIVAIGTAAIFLGKFSGDVLMGALTLGLLGLALIPMGFAFSVLGNINVGSIFAAILAISAIGVLAFTLGLLVAGPQGLILLAGIGMLALLGVALIPLALSLMLIGMVDGSKLITLGLGLLALVPALALMAMVSPLLPLVGFGLFMIAAAIFPLALAASMINPESVTSLNSLFTTLATSAPMMLMAAFGIAAISMALVTFATAVGIATGMLALVAVASVIGSFFGMGKINVLDQIFGLAQISGKLMQTANALNMIATAMQTLASALSTMGDSTSALETLDTIMSLDATQMQTLQDVSMAMDKISSANKQLTGENQAGKIGDAAGSGAGLAVVTNSSNSSNSTAIIGSPTGRSTDPSILFSSERYYSMIYR